MNLLDRRENGTVPLTLREGDRSMFSADHYPKNTPSRRKMDQSPDSPRTVTWIPSGQQKGAAVIHCCPHVRDDNRRSRLLAHHLPIGRQDHQDAENPGRRFRLRRRVEKPLTLGTEVRTIPVFGLNHALVTVRAENTHGSPSSQMYPANPPPGTKSAKPPSIESISYARPGYSDIRPSFPNRSLPVVVSGHGKDVILEIQNDFLDLTI